MVVRTIAYAHTCATGILCHAQIVCGVANHQSALGWHIKFFHQLVQHQWIGFASSLVSRS